MILILISLFILNAKVFENFEYKTRKELLKVWDSKNFMPGLTLDSNPYYYYPATLQNHKSRVMCVALRTMPIGVKVPKNFKPKKVDGESIKSIQIYKPVPKQYRDISKITKQHKHLYISWEWNTIIPPKGADDFTKSDNSFAIYAVFNTGFYSVKYIKYTWSPNTKIKYGYTAQISNNTRFVIVRRRATDPMGIWLKEKVDVLQDIKRFFPKKYKDFEFVAIAILSDSDDAKKPILACIDNIDISFK